jgi:hypothetical protein
VFPLYFYDGNNVIVSQDGSTYVSLEATASCKFVGGSINGKYFYYLTNSALNVVQNNFGLQITAPIIAGKMTLNQLYQFQASVLSGTPVTLAFPLFQTYLMQQTAATTVNLPAINYNNVGMVVCFARSSTTAFALTLTPASGNGILDFAGTSIATTLALASSVSSVSIASTTFSSTTNLFGWVVISKA